MIRFSSEEINFEKKEALRETQYARKSTKPNRVIKPFPLLFFSCFLMELCGDALKNLLFFGMCQNEPFVKDNRVKIISPQLHEGSPFFTPNRIFSVSVRQR